FLAEQSPNLDVEVELERRRTQVNRRVGLGLERNTQLARANSVAPPAGVRRSMAHGSQVEQRRSSITPSSPDLEEDTQILDSPYNNMQPRSRDTLNRAATAAAAT